MSAVDGLPIERNGCVLYEKDKAKDVTFVTPFFVFRYKSSASCTGTSPLRSGRPV